MTEDYQNQSRDQDLNQNLELDLHHPEKGVLRLHREGEELAVVRVLSKDEVVADLEVHDLGPEADPEVLEVFVIVRLQDVVMGEEVFLRDASHRDFPLAADHLRVDAGLHFLHLDVDPRVKTVEGLQLHHLLVDDQLVVQSHHHLYVK